ncbi:hypothetical protein N7488_009828 [Penicillium malachiteum]|nr:hypothetical protein N7488_009828 [Penicillium malachiteum]
MNASNSSLPTVDMKLSTCALFFITLGTTSSWKLQAGSQTWSGANPQGCKAMLIPRGAEISWRGTQGASTVQFFNVQGSCSTVYRTVQGVGEINASNNIYGFVVKA